MNVRWNFSSKKDNFRLSAVLQLPDTYKCLNGVVLGAIEGLCIFGTRFAYPCRCVDLIPHFGRSIPMP